MKDIQAARHAATNRIHARQRDVRLNMYTAGDMLEHRQILAGARLSHLSFPMTPRGQG